MNGNGYYFTESQVKYVRDLAAGTLNQQNKSGAAAQMQLALDHIGANKKLLTKIEPKTGRTLREVFLAQNPASVALRACTILKCYLINFSMAALLPQLLVGRLLPAFHVWWVEGIEAGNIGIYKGENNHTDPHFYWQENENALIYNYVRKDRYREYRRGPNDNDEHLLKEFIDSGVPVIGIREGPSAEEDSHSFIALRMLLKNTFIYVMIDTFHDKYNGKTLRWSSAQKAINKNDPVRFGPKGPRWCHNVYTHFASLDSATAELYAAIY